MLPEINVTSHRQLRDDERYEGEIVPIYAATNELPTRTIRNDIERLLSLLQNSYFLLEVLIYAAFAVAWVWLLSFTPLSRAYPFVALAFALTPLLGGVFFAESISPRLVLGLLFVLGGLFLIAG